ncbi:hypothetical protein [Paraburkholderia fungorum]|uniref:hypothetical protein n=1 Tax=Paraburkholderia TaxID=1822464 RepID=UPI003877D664
MARVIFSSNKEINEAVAKLVRQGWTYHDKGRRKHAKIVAENGRCMTIPCSTRNRNAVNDLQHRAQRLAALPSLTVAEGIEP